MAKVKPIPDGYHTVTPYLVLDDCAAAIDFYKKAFGAEELFRMPGPDGKIGHAEIRIGDSPVMMSDEMSMPGQECVNKAPRSAGVATAGLFLYVTDVDSAFERAVKAGCTVRAPLMDMFWGDRYGKLVDPFGHHWSMSTKKEELTPEQIQQRFEEMMKQQKPR